MVRNDTKKVSILTKLGYGIGQMGDSIGYNIFYSFFLFFLTDIVGLSPAIAGVVSILAVLWDGITDPIVGFLSDNFGSKKGRRRPFMIFSAVPYGICMFLLFYDVNLPASVKGPYFILISMLFFTFYTIFTIPYSALGSELTDDFNERNSVRVFASIFMYISVMLATAAPHMIVDITERNGGTITQGWRNVGILFGLLIFLAIIFCSIFTKGIEHMPEEKKEKEKLADILKTYISVVKLRPLKILGLTILFWTFTTSLRQSASMYLIANLLGYSAELRSLISAFLSVMAILWLPVINLMSNKLDKKNFYACAMLISGIGLLVFRYIGFPSPVFMFIMIAIYALGNTTFWTISYSMMYDIGSFDEFVQGNDRTGSIVAIMSFLQKLGAAISLWFAGMLLEFGGYVPGQAFTQETSSLVLNLNTTFPGVIGILAGMVAFLYPITRKKYHMLQAAKENRKEGNLFSTEEFKNIIG